MPPASSRGTLYVVATPIGNLEDITLRGVRVLREAAVVAAEDTRRTSKLLNHLGIATRTLSLHAHNERDRIPAVLAHLSRGESVALVTDAGTPVVSDPGSLVVAAAVADGYRVEPIPGASAVLAALAGSGLAHDRFVFWGFPPNKQMARRRFYEEAAVPGLPFVVFEAPHRLVASLEDAQTVLGNRRVVVARELTKVHEEFVRGSIAEAIRIFRAREVIGELTLVFEGVEPEPDARDPLPDSAIWAELTRLATTGRTRREAIAELATREGRSARDIYAAAERGKPGSGEAVADEG
jgi:16S rRNA (cytidine1402-2'-O)-methyltransferase